MDHLLSLGAGTSMWVDRDDEGWYVSIEEEPDRLPSNMDFEIYGVRVTVNSTQPALPEGGPT